jgi:hypothetical protein
MTVLPLLCALLAPQTPDTATAAFVARLRAARDRNERLVTSYTATARQRLGVGLRALSRDRMLYRQELVARIEWRRDAPSTITVIGAREGVPVAVSGDRIPEDLERDISSLVLNPAQDYLRPLGDRSGDGFVYPLREGADADYAYAAGDTTTITLPDGRRIRLAALHVTPRRSDWRLLAGTLWFDAETHGLVRLAARPARPYEFQRDADAEDREGIPGFVNPGLEVRFITIEYGLYEGRWWMPRFMAIEAVGTMGSWLGMPFRLERVYEDYEVQGGSPAPPGASAFRSAGTVIRLDEIADTAARRRAADSLRAAVEACVAQQGGPPRAARGRCWRRVREPNLEVIVSADSTALVTSTELGAPILAMGDLLSEHDLPGLAQLLRGLRDPQLGTYVRLPRGVTALLEEARYNRIEGLSLGLRAGLDRGATTLTAAARLGMADLVPNVELTLLRRVAETRVSFAGYRRLAAANPEVRPFGPVNSILALLAQRDDGEYYRSHGVELTAENINAGWWSLRVYAQRELPARGETRISLPTLFDPDRRFRPNIVADSADQVGAVFALRGSRTLSRGVTVGAHLRLDGAAGDFQFGRGAVTLRLVATPRGRLAAGLALSAGTSTGRVPTQHRFYLGGAPTLRGYPGGVLTGEAYWSVRAEAGTGRPAARLVLFGDYGWAGQRIDFDRGRPLIGGGVGASFFDGLLRLDLARGLRAPTGWRLEFYVDGLL